MKKILITLLSISSLTAMAQNDSTTKPLTVSAYVETFLGSHQMETGLALFIRITGTMNLM